MTDGNSRAGIFRVGFGLERIGLLAQRFPVVFSLVILMITGLALVGLTKLAFDGDVTAVLPDQSQAYRDKEEIDRSFRDFGSDITILVESDRIATAAGLEDLRDLQLEIALTDGIANTVSIFSAIRIDGTTGETEQWFPLMFDDDRQAAELIDALTRNHPQTASLLSVERGVAVIQASLAGELGFADPDSYRTFDNMRDIARAAAPEDFRVSFTGLTPIGETIVSAIISDQYRLTIIGMILGTGIAFIIFRSIIAAIVCAVPPGLTALWTLGVFGLLGYKVNYLTTVLPTLALILAFADGIFLYYRWQTETARTGDGVASLIATIKRVGPASALTSITTALAFLSFYYAESEALKQFALLGTAAVTLAFIAVIIGQPVLLHWLLKSGLAIRGARHEPMFQFIGRWVRPLALGFPAMTAIVGVFAVVALFTVYTKVRPEYRVSDYLPADSEVRYAETVANEVLGGRDTLQIAIPMPESGGFKNPANRDRLIEAHQIVESRFGAGRVFSAASLFNRFDNDEAINSFIDRAYEEQEESRSDLISGDDSQSLISLRIGSNLPAHDVQMQLDELHAAFAQEPWGDKVIVAGFPVLMTVEFTGLIDQLRTSLMIAIGLGILVIGLSTASPVIAIAAITPNLLPILIVQFVLYLMGGVINLSEVVALTIAFGIAVDNAVHLINVYDANRREGRETYHALSSAIAEAGPALAAGTVIICVSTIVTQLSRLPTVPVLGQLIVVVLFVALAANTIVLPANMLILERIRKKLHLGK